MLNGLTGVFTLLRFADDGAEVICDASGMQTAFYGIVKGKKYVSSHMCLLGELLRLSMDPYVEKLIHYRFFHLFGNALPGDLTQYAEIKRATPNFIAALHGNSIETKRFYSPHSLGLDSDRAAELAGDLFRRNMELIARKWEKPAISLSGGCDSKTTLACAAEHYDRFRYYSFISSEAEAVDAAAAEKICRSLGLEHRTYRIPDRDEEVDDPLETGMMLRWNCGNLLDSNANDIRKQAFFAKVTDFDVEVKSWASEIGRAYYSKRFHGKTEFGDAPTHRACTTMYKVFMHNRPLVKQTDKVFADFLNRYYSPDPECPLPWQEQFFWEYRVPAWNGLVITGEHRYCHDITIPYNNRTLLELLLSVPLRDRIEDTVYSKIRENMDPRIDQTGIFVTNLKHTKRRAQLEKLYYDVHGKLRF